MMAFSPAFFPSHIHLGDIDIETRESFCDMGNHTRNILMHDDDSRGIHVKRDGKAIEFRDLDISPPMEIPVTLMDLCSFFTVILVVLG